MRKKLTYGVYITVILVILMIFGSQIILRFYKVQSERLIIEYHEISVLQDYKLSVSRLMMQLNFLRNESSVLFSSDLLAFYTDSKTKFENCHQFLTTKHKDDDWIGLEIAINNFDTMLTRALLAGEKISISTIIDLTNLMIAGNEKLDILINETKEEIMHYEQINRRAIQHGTLTSLGLGAAMIILLLVLGKVYVNNLTDPILKLEKGAESIKTGNRQARVNIHSGDEFEKLADAFNSMLDSLEETTVTKEYFQNIMNSLYGALFVLNDGCTIRAVNTTSIQMYEFTEYEMLDKPINILLNGNDGQHFNVDFSQMDFQEKVDFFNNQHVMITKSGKQIPVLINCTRLKSQKPGSNEILIIAHDITEKIMMEKKIEQNRNEIRIAINEAQEAERLRLAKDLHDSLGQQLTSISFSIQKLHESKKYSGNLVQSVMDQIDASLNETRRLSHNLIPIVLIEFGLITAIQNLINNVNKIGKTKFQFFHYDLNERIDNKLEKAIYRIIQEGINNILKHAKAKNASIQLLQNAELLTVLIEDDGVGFKAMNRLTNEIVQDEGIGLLSIRERVSIFNGKFSIESHPGAGTELIIEIPYNK